MRLPKHTFFGIALGVLASALPLDHVEAVPPVTSASAAPAASASAALIPWRPHRGEPTTVEPVNSCLNCHATLADPKLRNPAKEHGAGVHRDERIGCTGCHKGDPRDATVGAHSPAAGFNPHPKHEEVPAICGSCHSDPSYMRHINARLPGGQAALYELSLHGQRTAKGDAAAPDCADCHGRHLILSPASPSSPVNRANVAKLCGGCHSDPKRMARSRIATDQVAKWERGVHGQAFKKGRADAPTCTGCHGAHSATPPEASSVARACGRCHEQELSYFEESPHDKGFRQRGLAECVACHGNHDIAPPTARLVGTTSDATCMKCHSRDEKPRQVADEIARMLQRARDRADGARGAVMRARASGLHVSGAELALARVTTAELELRVLVHTLTASRLEGPVAAVDRAVAETEKLIADAEATRKAERRGYYLALALAAALFVSLGVKSRQIERARQGGS